MKDFEEIRGLWKIQSPEPINIDDVLKKIEKQKRSYIQRLLIQTIAAAIALLFIVTVWLTATFHTWTSHLSMMIVIGSLYYFFRTQILDYYKINKTPCLFKKPDEYIAHVKEYKKSRFRFNTKSYQVYLLLIALALCLFAVEIYYILPMHQLLIYVGLSAGWVILCEFVFRKQYVRKEEQRLQEMIQELERLSQQFL